MITKISMLERVTKINQTFALEIMLTKCLGNDFDEMIHYKFKGTDSDLVRILTSYNIKKACRVKPFWETLF